MRIDNGFFFAIGGFFLGGYLFFKGFGWLKQKKLIENTPTSKVRSIAMGSVEVYGEVLPAQKQVLKSPFSNIDCIYYRYTIEEHRRSGKSSHWVTIRQGSERIPFFLRDDTGHVLIDPKGANIDVPIHAEFNSSMGRDPPKMVMDFLKKENISFESLFGINKTLRYREYYISVKEKIYIMGTAGDNPFVKDGNAKDSAENVMIQKGKYNSFYYISDKPEKEILKSYKWKVIGGLFGGTTLIVGCLAIIIFIYLGIF